MAEKHAQYFEGILQLRPVNDEILGWIDAEVTRTGKARIAKIKKVAGGVDLYFSSQHYLQSLGHQLQQRFGGILKITSRLHTCNPITSKDVHRVTVLFKSLPFKKGNAILFQGERWKILSVGNQINLQNISSGKKMRVLADKLAEHIA